MIGILTLLTVSGYSLNAGKTPARGSPSFFPPLLEESEASEPVSRSLTNHKMDEAPGKNWRICHWNGKPLRVGISSCLLGEEVRWDGGHKRDATINDLLGPFFEWISVCPELEAGMGVPREPIHLVGPAGAERLVGVDSGKDWTVRMQRLARRRVEQLEALDLCGYLLKKDSPSCGMERVRVRTSHARVPRTGVGVFARVLMARMPLLPVEDESRLRNPARRENFIDRVFAYRRLRDLMKAGCTRSRLAAFHAAHKYLLLSHSPRHYRELGRLVDGVKRHPPQRLGKIYAEAFMETLRNPATVKGHFNALQHLSHLLEQHLSDREKAELKGILHEYRRGWVPRIVPLTLLRHHGSKHGIDSVTNQVCLNPHPKQLMLRHHS